MNRGIGHHDVAPAPLAVRRSHETLQFRFSADVAGKRQGHPSSDLFVDALRGSFAGVGVTAENDDFGAMFRHAERTGIANAATRSGDDCDLVREVKKR
ncbi:hypothetical protein HDG37_003878 [Paraburkholderia sp. MM5384-R2]|nr:hypothetical protein [Paraburkholderia sp. MM5384-R2]